MLLTARTRCLCLWQFKHAESSYVKKPTFPNSTWNQWTKSHRGGAAVNSNLFIYLFIYLYLHCAFVAIQAFYYPPRAGFPIGTVDSPKHYMLEIHYDNPEGIEGQ